MGQWSFGSKFMNLNPEKIYLPGETFNLSFTKKINLVFCLIPSGTFLMGSETGEARETPVHEVEITTSFFLGKFTVTQSQWIHFMGTNPSEYKKYRSSPVERVSWFDCQEFIQKLNVMFPGYMFSLPTEAEWEYSCRAGTNGDFAGDLDEMAWYGNKFGGNTHPAGLKKPNPWGLHDMHGNIWEWCSDWFDEGYYSISPKKDPQGPPSGEFKVVRGGDFYHHRSHCRSSDRFYGSPKESWLGYGFRLAMRIS